MLTLWEWLDEHYDPEYLQKLNEQKNRLAFELDHEDE